MEIKTSESVSFLVDVVGCVLGSVILTVVVSVLLNCVVMML